MFPQRKLMVNQNLTEYSGDTDVVKLSVIYLKYFKLINRTLFCKSFLYIVS